MAAVKIKSYKVAQRGMRGVIVSLPPVWVQDLSLKAGDRLDIYRDEADRLIIVRQGASPNQIDAAAGQAREMADALGAMA